jgi:hypothetical protein
MSIILAALALAGAQASGQSAPAPEGHAGHAQHQQQKDGQDQRDCCCCKDMGKDHKMDCCDGRDGAGRQDHSAHPSSH